LNGWSFKRSVQSVLLKCVHCRCRVDMVCRSAPPPRADVLVCGVNVPRFLLVCALFSWCALSTSALWARRALSACLLSAIPIPHVSVCHAVLMPRVPFGVLFHHAPILVWCALPPRADPRLVLPFNPSGHLNHHSTQHPSNPNICAPNIRAPNTPNIRSQYPFNSTSRGTPATEHRVQSATGCWHADGDVGTLIGTR
jgi:hypothetical protein